MASDLEMQEQVMKAYSGEEWRNKVRRMRPDQIAAIYLRLKAQGKLK